MRPRTRMFEEEQAFLMAYRGPFDGFHATEASVSKTCLMRFDNNRYSVEARAVGQPVDVAAHRGRRPDLGHRVDEGGDGLGRRRQRGFPALGAPSGEDAQVGPHRALGVLVDAGGDREVHGRDRCLPVEPPPDMLRGRGHCQGGIRVA